MHTQSARQLAVYHRLWSWAIYLASPQLLPHSLPSRRGCRAHAIHVKAACASFCCLESMHLQLPRLTSLVSLASTQCNACRLSCA